MTPIIRYVVWLAKSTVLKSSRKSLPLQSERVGVRGISPMSLS